MSDFFTLEMLATFAGATMAVGIITEIFKRMGVLQLVPTQAISYVVAAIIMLVSNVALGTFGWQTAFLSLLNAAVVSLASNGGYDLVKSAVEYSEKPNLGEKEENIHRNL